ncbi:hypothetical protein GCM10010254_62960 [Streptomyces chromofuscus]|nr:hypothetical protein GCM10010254_62960 [Streptomyces chromofuscus]
MPFGPDEIQWELTCGIGPDGHWQGWFGVRVAPDALRRLGLHPDQPTSAVVGPSPPGWWHAAAERTAHQHRDAVRPYPSRGTAEPVVTPSPLRARRPPDRAPRGAACGPGGSVPRA